MQSYIILTNNPNLEPSVKKFNYLCNMDKVYKSRVAKWYIALCIAMTGIFVWSIFLCYNTALVLIIDAVLMGISLFMIYDIPTNEWRGVL